MKHFRMIFIVPLVFLVFLGCKIYGILPPPPPPPPTNCLDNTLTVIEALKDTYPLVIVEGDYQPDKRHVDCFYWEDGKWRRGRWTGSKIIEISQDYAFSATVYSYEEYLERVKVLGWR